jgi:glucosamine--fructose-6-phosphate aminotransferase (isomerizing)
VIVGARRGSPLIIGIGDNEHFLASDVTAVALHTRKVVYLQDNDIVTMTPDAFSVTKADATSASVQISQIDFDATAVEQGDYAHYMLKEIFEQPRTIENALRGRLDRDASTAVRRAEHVAGGIALGESHRGHRVRHELARGWWANI